MYPKRDPKSLQPQQSHSGDIELSKLMSWILRHGANEQSLPIDTNGFVDADVLLKHQRFVSKRYNLDDVKRVVANDQKRRFTLDLLPNGKIRIKANQGHSMTNVQMVMRKIDDPSEIPIAIHGTYFRFWKKIKEEGLKRMTRNHIHMTGCEQFNAEISGFRASCQILIYVNVCKAISDGIVFYKSENDVILTEGLNGVLSNKYFAKVVDRATNHLLD